MAPGIVDTRTKSASAPNTEFLTLPDCVQGSGRGQGLLESPASRERGLEARAGPKAPQSPGCPRARVVATVRPLMGSSAHIVRAILFPAPCAPRGGVLPGPVGSVPGPMEAVDPTLSVRWTHMLRHAARWRHLNSDILDYRYERLVISNGMEVTGRIHRICEILTLAECCARARQIAPATLSPRARRSSTWPERPATGNVPIRSASRRGSRTTGRSASSGRSPSGGPRPGRSSRPRPAPMALRLRSRRPGSVCLARDRRGASPPPAIMEW